MSGTALSLVPLLARRAGASGKSPAATSSSAGASTGNSTNDPTYTPSGGSAGAGTPNSSNAGASASAGTNVGYNGTGDSTNTTSAGSGGGSSGATAGSTASTAEATTTTAPPRRPTADDIVILSFAQSMELTIRDLYDIAINLGSFAGAQLEAVNAIRDAHEAYGQSISGLLGRSAPNATLPKLYSAMKGDFAGSAEAVAKVARSLENTAAATHVDVLGKLVGVDGAALIASILVVEARNATVLANFAGVTKLDDQLATDGKALSPADYSTK